MKKFTLGFVGGVSALALAVPLLAQVTSAQSVTSSITNGNRQTPSQACLTAMVAMEDYHLANFDTMIADQKKMMQAHRDALKAASAITDETARKAALEKAQQDMKTAMEAKKDTTPSTEVQTLMSNIRTACGNTMKFMGMPGGHDMRPMGMGMEMHDKRGMKMGWFKGKHATQSSTSTPTNNQ